jgi:hypothetical protein
LWIASVLSRCSLLYEPERRLRSKFEQFFRESKQQVTQKNRVPRRNLRFPASRAPPVWISLSRMPYTQRQKTTMYFEKIAHGKGPVVAQWQ